MKCSECGKDQSLSSCAVTDSRVKDDVRNRRRRCSNCGHRFNTTEKVEMVEDLKWLRMPFDYHAPFHAFADTSTVSVCGQKQRAPNMIQPFGHNKPCKSCAR